MTTDQPLSRAMLAEHDTDYAKALTVCDSLADLKALVTRYQELVVDAVPVVAAMTEADFQAFRKGLKSERRGKFAGEEWAERFGAVLMPLPMMTITQVAAQFQAPFGVTWQRLRDLRPDLLEVPPARASHGTPEQP